MHKEIKYSNVFGKLFPVLLSFQFFTAAVEGVFIQHKLITSEHRSYMRHGGLLGLQGTTLAVHMNWSKTTLRLNSNLEYMLALLLIVGSLLLIVGSLLLIVGSAR